MEVILLERIARLGAVGDTVKVRDGFARNFLLPQKKALRATEINKKVFEERRAEIEAQNAEAKAEAEKFAASMKDVSLTLQRQASDEGKLYGAINVRDVAEGLAELGHKVERSQINLPGPIKHTGTYKVIILPHAEVEIKLDLTVKRTEIAGADEAA